MNWQEFKNKITEIERPLVERYLSILIEKSPDTVLEIGSGWGLFSRSVMEYQERSGKQIKFVTIDKNTDLKQFHENMAGYKDKIKMITGDSKVIVNSMVLAGERFDFVFIDGDHGYDGFKADFNLCQKLGNTIMCDDVFHKNNFGKDYGVMQYLAEFIKKEQITPSFYPEGNGLCLI